MIKDNGLREKLNVGIRSEDELLPGVYLAPQRDSQQR